MNTDTIILTNNSSVYATAVAFSSIKTAILLTMYKTKTLTSSPHKNSLAELI